MTCRRQPVERRQRPPAPCNRPGTQARNRSSTRKHRRKAPYAAPDFRERADQPEPECVRDPLDH